LDDRNFCWFPPMNHANYFWLTGPSSPLHTTLPRPTDRRQRLTWWFTPNSPDYWSFAAAEQKSKDATVPSPMQTCHRTNESHAVNENFGHSGLSITCGTGFTRMTAEVAPGRIGIVLRLEISRLACNNANGGQLFDHGHACPRRRRRLSPGHSGRSARWPSDVHHRWWLRSG